MKSLLSTYFIVFLLIQSSIQECTDPSSCQTCQTGQDCSACSLSSQLSYIFSTTCTQCSSLLTGCLNCSSSTSCSVCDQQNNYFLNQTNLCSCKASYYYNSSSLLCEPCNLTLPSCTFCLNATFCAECQRGYWIELQIISSEAGDFNQQCKSCADSMTGCAKCNTNSTCLECNSEKNFELNNQQCQCKNGYIIKQEQIEGISAAVSSCKICNQLFQNCLTCNSTCTQCLMGYYFQNFTGGECLPCAMPGCIECHTSTACDKCDSTKNFKEQYPDCICIANYRIFQNTTCIPCTQQQPCPECQYLTQYYNDTDYTCHPCSDIPGCEDCRSATFCQRCSFQNNMKTSYQEGTCSCADYHFYNQSSDDRSVCYPCYQIIQNCSWCNNNTSCDTCDYGYAVSQDTRRCDPCESYITGCVNCLNRSVCILCNRTQKMVLLGIECGCQLYYFMTYEGKCSSCFQWSDHCEICNNYTCLRCKPGYSKNTSGGCERSCKIDLCLNCYNQSLCQICEPFSKLSSSLKECVCMEGYYLDGGMCKGCKECGENKICKECKDGWKLDKEKNLCEKFGEWLKVGLLLCGVILIIGVI